MRIDESGGVLESLRDVDVVDLRGREQRRRAERRGTSSAQVRMVGTGSVLVATGDTETEDSRSSKNSMTQD